MVLTALTPLLPANPSFAGHQTFAFRLGWLKKGIDALSDPAAGGPVLFSRPDALVTLGVGKNMVQSIRYWLLTTRMATEANRQIYPTALGTRLFGGADQPGWDPFLEDDASLWLLHWQLAGPGSLAFTWAYTFNQFREHEFSRDTLTDAVRRAAEGVVSKIPSRETLLRDVECLLHTYVSGDSRMAADDGLECPLQGLGLIRPGFERLYRFQVGPKPTLPPLLFAYALTEFWQWRQGDTPTLSVWDIVYAEGGPGAVFKLNEDAVLERLDTLEEVSGGVYQFEDTALVRQVVLKAQTAPPAITFLERHYAR